MRKVSLVLAGALVLGVLVFVGAWQVAARLCESRFADGVDDLAWLQEEFGLNETELARVRELHEAYLPECEAYCREIAARQARLEDLLGQGKLADPEVEPTLLEIGEWRARCQANMLRHFRRVADAMPPEEGARYLEVMTRLTLGAHESFERQMTPDQERGSEAHVHGAQH